MIVCQIVGHMLLFLVIILTQINAEKYVNDNATLILLHVIFRHGNSTPMKSHLCLNDARINNTYEDNDGYAHLTTEGKKREFNVGRMLRAKYFDWANKSCRVDRISAVSTIYERTQMSLQLVLAGFCPPNSSEKVHKNLNWQPIPYSVDGQKTFVGLPPMTCPYFNKLYYQQLESNMGQKLIDKSYYELLSKECLKKVKTPRDLLKIYVSLEDYGKTNFSLNLSVIESLAVKEYVLATSTSKLKKLSAGIILKKILKESYRKKNKSQNSLINVYLYSGHEYTIGTMLCTLNVFDNFIPPYGATLIFELHKINNIYGIKLYYINYKQEEPKLLIIPGCHEFCPLETLSKLVEDSIPNDTDTCDIPERKSLAISLKLSMFLFVLSNIYQFILI